MLRGIFFCYINEYLLEIMAYCHIELRQYTNAIECLDECEETCGDLVPDVFSEELKQEC